MVLGGLSFLSRSSGAVSTARRQPPAAEVRRVARRRSGREGEAAGRAAAGGSRPFRLLLFAAFSVLSWQATRNSHQFAAVVGTVTAWNFGEWAAAVAGGVRDLGGRRRTRPLGAGPAAGGARGGRRRSSRAGRQRPVLRLGRRGADVGLGRAAALVPARGGRSSPGAPGCPTGSSASTTATPASIEYYNGPEQKVFADARLEVMGPELYERVPRPRRGSRRRRPAGPVELGRDGPARASWSTTSSPSWPGWRRSLLGSPRLAVRLVRPDRRRSSPRANASHRRARPSTSRRGTSAASRSRARGARRCSPRRRRR